MPDNNGLQRTALRAAAEAERYAHERLSFLVQTSLGFERTPQVE
jgi:hypothetical protein